VSKNIEQRQRLNSIEGMIPSPYHRPTGCQFHPRCDQFMEGVCDQITPERIHLGDHREVRCLLYDENIIAADIIRVKDAE
jgi:peptide/nickel transport system ATP-binding protein